MALILFYHIRTLVKMGTKKIIFLFLIQTYDVGTQKNLLNERVLWITQNLMLKIMDKKILTIIG